MVNPEQRIPRELPPDVYGFAGRDPELSTLDGLLAGARSSAVVIAAVTGTAGVGKTALAVHWAHRVADRFADGILYLDLRGYDPEQPMEPAEALASLLRALGLDGAEIPVELAERAARYRSLVAGRRMLVLLDNARDADQVRALLPGTASCFVLVTSRDSLGGLVVRYGARRVDLGLLTPDDAIGLLRTLVGDERVDADPAGARALVDRCARLPLALRIAAEFAAVRPRTILTGLADELVDETRRLDRFDAGADDRTAVRAVFSWSYRQLPAEAARVFRLLGLHPGHDFDRYAAVALTGVSLADARRLLDTLSRAHLVQEIGRGRYGMHDLLRAYASDRVDADGEPDRRAALTGLFHYYLATAAVAMDVAFPAERHRRPRVPPPRTPTPVIDGPARARAWLDSERANLVAATAHIADHGPPTHASYVAMTVARYLDTGAHYDDALVVHGHALRVARAHGDRYGEGAALHHLGTVYRCWGRSDEAVSHYEQALALHREVGDRTAEGVTLAHLAIVYRQRSMFDESVQHYRRALTIHREVGDRIGEGIVLDHLGIVYDQLGLYEEAVEHYQQALATHREIGDRSGEGTTLGHLGGASGRLGRHEEALAYLKEALEIVREIGNRAAEGDLLDELGLVHLRWGRHDEAHRHLREARELHHGIGNREGEALALAHLGGLDSRLGRHAEARDHYERALAIAAGMGARHVESIARNGLGEVARAVGAADEAHGHYDKALDLARDGADREVQARALDGIARVLLATGDADGAREHWHDALTLYGDLRTPEADEAREALEALDALEQGQEPA